MPYSASVLEHLDTLADERYPAGSMKATGPGRGELVIADAALKDLDLLLASLDPSVGVCRVGSGEEAIGTLMVALGNGYGRIHLLGHGAPGSIRFGSDLLGAEAFSSLADAVPADGAMPSLHFWSCSTGAASVGRSFVDAVSYALRAGVTAFSGLVGSMKAGGNWVPDIFSHAMQPVACPFQNSAAYGFTLPVAATPPTLELRTTVSGSSIYVEIWSKAGILPFNSVNLSLLYDPAQATYVSYTTPISWFGTASSGQFGAVGFDMVDTTADTLLVTMRFTALTNAAAIGFHLNPDPAFTYLQIADLNTNTIQNLDLGPLPYLFVIPENAATGTILAEDAWAGSMTYSLVDPPVDGSGNPLFSIDPITGAVSLTAAGHDTIDYESSTKSYSLTVVAGDGVPAHDQTRIMTVSLLNVNDNAPVLTVDNATVTLAENAAAGVIGGADADATDADVDTVTFSLVDPPVDGDGHALFSINAATGVVSLTTYGHAVIDYESATKSYELTVKASDGLGAHDQTQTITVNLTDVNEAPVLTVKNPIVTLAEDAPAGVIEGADADAVDPENDTITYSLESPPVDGSSNPLFSIDSSGLVSLTEAGHATIDYDFDTRSYVLTVKASDGIGAHDQTSTITVNLTNVNDTPPVLTVDNATVSLAENALAGVIGGADADATDADGDTVTFSLVAPPVDGSSNPLFSINPTTGEVSLTEAGHAAIDYESATKSYELTVKASDGLGSHDQTRTITVNLTDVNEAPVLHANFTTRDYNDSPAADNFGSDSGLLTTTDQDDGDSAHYSVQGQTTGSYSLFGTDYDCMKVGTYGTLYLNSLSGDYLYETNNTAIEGLKSTDSEVFTLVVTDSGSLTDTKTLTINVIGTNDVPVLGSVAPGSIEEIDQSSNTTDAGLGGTLNSSDRDNGESLTYGIDILGGADSGDNTVSEIGKYGTLTVNTLTGEYSYAKNAGAIEALAFDESDTDSFTMKVTDGSGASATQDYTVTVTGANDAPTLDEVTSGSIVENTLSSGTTDGNLTGSLAAHDVDHDAVLSYGILNGGTTVQSLVGFFGTLNVDSVTGAYSYVKSAAAVEALTDGDKLSDEFTVIVTDDQGASSTQSYTVSLGGANDAPVLHATVVTAGYGDTAADDTFGSVKGTLSRTDVDAGDGAAFSIDGQESDNYTINGSSYDSSKVGSYGTLYLDGTTGAYEFVPNDASIEGRKTNDSENFTFVVTDTSGATDTKTLTINITGANDTPELGAVTAGTIHEVDQSSTTDDLGLGGTLGSSDRDNPETLTYGIDGSGVTENGGGNGTVSKTGTYGTLTVNTSTGEYSFAKNVAAIEALDAGESGSDSFTLKLTDGSGVTVTQDYTVSVTGADDAPLLGTITSGSIVETALSSAVTETDLAGTLSGSDVDVETLTYGIDGSNVTDNGDGTVSRTGTYGTLTVTTATGAYSYVRSSSTVERLAMNEEVTDDFTMTVWDGDGNLVTQIYRVNLNGANDAPVLSATPTSVTYADSAADDTLDSVTGELSRKDEDHGDTAVYSITSQSTGSYSINGNSYDCSKVGSYGTLYLNSASGAYEFVPNDTTIEARKTDTSESFTLVVTDGGGATDTKTLTIDITGANDTPVLNTVTQGSIAEVDQSATTDDIGLGGTLISSDRDNPETLTYGFNGTGVVDNGNGTVSKAGTYGTLTVNTSTGLYSFAKNAATIEALDSGENGSDNFTFSLTDGSGVTVTQGYTVTVTGADDAPVLGAVTSGSITETLLSSAVTETGLAGTLSGSDVDVEALTYGIGGTGVTDNGDGTVSRVGAYGTLTVTTATGAYNYVRDAAAVETLGKDATASDVFTVTVSDGDGAAVTQTYTVNLTGANDAPVLGATLTSATYTDTAADDSFTSVTGTLSRTDVDTGDIPTYSITSQSTGSYSINSINYDCSKVGSYGTLYLNSTTGAYTFVPNDTTIEGRKTDTSESFTLVVTDGGSATDTKTLTINITGSNDTPVLDEVTPGTIHENDQSSATTDVGLTGTLTSSDRDSGESLTYGIDGTGVTDNGDGTVSKTGTYGTLTVNTTSGAYSFLKNAGVIEALDSGENGSDSFTVKLTDGSGASATQGYTVTVTGADDAPVLGSVTSGTIAETLLSNAVTETGLTGTLSGSDVDVEALTYGMGGTGVTVNGDGTVSRAGAYGTLTVDASTGAYSYVRNVAAVETLGKDAIATDVFTVTVTDGDGSLVTQTYTVNLTGANDAPVLGATLTSATYTDTAADDSFTSVTGTLSRTDVDTGDLPTYSIASQTTGSYSINSINYDCSKVGSYGTLYLNSTTGAYTFVPNDTTIEGRKTADSESFTLVVTDGGSATDTKTLTINITGSNDIPVLDSVMSGSITEVDQSASTTDAGLAGTLTSSDRDNPETLTYGINGTGVVDNGNGTVSKVGSYGTLTVNTSTGVYSYAKNAGAIESLVLDESHSDTFTVSLTDGSGASVTQSYSVHLTGANDAPVLSATLTTATYTDTSADDTFTSVTGTLSRTDVDTGDSALYSIESQTTGSYTINSSIYDSMKVGLYGTLYLDSTSGAYEYVPNDAAIEGRKTNDSESFTLVVTDGHSATDTKTLTINITGANDTPVLNAVTPGSIHENDQSSGTTDLGLSGTLSSNDRDNGESLTYGISALGAETDAGNSSVSMDGLYGTLTVNTSTGAYSYAKNVAAIEALDDGETASDNFTVTLTDGSGSMVTRQYMVSVTGADDAPVLGAVSSGTIVETSLSSAVTETGLTGTLSGSDVDVETLSYGIGGTGVTDNGDGTVSKAGVYGTLTVTTATGAYSYEKSAAAVEALGRTATASDEFTVTVTDGDGAAVAQNYTVNLTGANDAPVLSATLTTASYTDTLVDDSFTNVTGTLSRTDVDTGDSYLYSISSQSTGSYSINSVNYDCTKVGLYGTLYLDSTSGAYVYVPDDTAIEGRKTNDSESFTLVVTDGGSATDTKTLTINITGANDTPVLNAVMQGTIAEVDQSASTDDLGLGGTLTSSDRDTSDTPTYGINGTGVVDNGNGTVSKAGTFGTLTVNTSTGVYSFARNAGTIEALDSGETGSDSFTMKVTDGSGASATQGYTVTVTGADDAPVLGSVTSGTIGEVALSSTVVETGLTGTLSGSDVDVETLTYGISGTGVTDNGDGTVSRAGAYGTLTVTTATGAYSYVKDAAAVEALGRTATASDAFTVTVTDGDGALVTQGYTVNLTGANDAPVLSATLTTASYTDTAADDTFTSVTGTLSRTDVDTGDSYLYSITSQVTGSYTINSSSYNCMKAGLYGTLYLNSTSGAYEFVPNDTAIEGVKADTSESFTLVVTDGGSATDTKTLTINITGANDTPVLNAVTSGTIAEVDQSSSTTDTGLGGTLTSSDRDTSDTPTYGINGTGVVDNGNGTVSKAGTFGTLTVNTSTGVYSFARNAGTIEALDSGETGSDSFTMKVTDGSGASATQGYTVTVTGADDAPVLGAVTTGTIVETSLSSAVVETGLTGTLSGSDVDVETLTYGISGTGVTDNGDGTVSRAGAYGTLTVTTATGAYSYVKTAAAVEALGRTATASDAFTVTVTDGDGALVTQGYTVNLTGANDAPVLSATLTTATYTDTAADDTFTSVTGTLSRTDVDTGDSYLYSITSQVTGSYSINSSSYDCSKVGLYGTLYLNSTSGAYVYVPNDTAIEGLKTDMSENFTLEVTDGGSATDTKTLTINITGSNDTPVLNAVTQGTIAEVDQSASTDDLGLGGTLTSSDRDISDTPTYGINGTGVVDNGNGTVSKAGTFGTLTVNTSTGVYSFARNAGAIEALDSGETGSDSFTMKVTDGSGASVTQSYTVTVTGADDAPVLGAVTTGTIVETSLSSAVTETGLTGTLSGSDVDVETLSYGIGGTGVTVNGDGTVSKAGAYGTLTVNTSTGSYSFVKDAAAVEALGRTATASDAFTLTVTDGDGSLVTQGYTVNLTGANDAPVLSATLTTATYTDTAADDTFTSVTGTLSRTDVDTGDSYLYSIASQTTGSYTIHSNSYNCMKVGLYGTLYLNSTSGAYEYVPDDTAIEGRKTDTSESFSLVVTDGGSTTDTKTLTINITGSNDTPVLGAVTAGTIAEVDQSASTTDAGLTGTLTSSDRDSSDTPTYGINGSGVVDNGNGTVSKDGVYGTLTVNASTGAYSYAKHDAVIEALGVGDIDSDSFTVSVTDGSGAVAMQGYTVTVTGANDAPVFTSGGTGTVAENEPASTVIYTAHAGDVDGDTITYSLGGTDASLLNIDSSTGTVTLKNSADYESKTTYSFDLLADDGHVSHEVSKAVVVSITDVNEAPSSTDDSVTMFDDVNKELSLSDFGIYSDPESVAIVDVKIISLPSEGTLEYSLDKITWNPVQVDDLIPAADITAGKLRFVPVSGMHSVTVGFQVSDGVLLSSSTYTLNIIPEHAVTLPTGTDTVTNGSGATIYTVDIPAGITFVSEVLTDTGLSVDEQLNGFADNLITDPATYEQVHDEIDSYVAGIGSTTVEVRSIALDDSSGFDPSHPVVINGSVGGTEALVIDASKLPHGTIIDLHNVEFAIIIGPAHLEGGSGSNIIIADGADQYIMLGPGNDTIQGGGGNDSVGSDGGNDKVYGDEGNDFVYGGPGNDSLYGGTGNDTLRGDIGNDFIDGGDDDDTAIFSANHTRYSISYDAGTYTVVDTVSGGGDGTDTVTGVEHFQFLDGTFDPAAIVDNTPPVVSSMSPTDAATGVGVSDNIVFRFSEAIERGTGLIEIHSGTAGGAVVESYNASNTHVTITSDTLTIDPTANLSNGTDYYVTFASGSVHDFAGNNYAGTSSYHFSTVAAAVAANGGSSGGGAGVVLAGVAGIGILAWLIL